MFEGIIFCKQYVVIKAGKNVNADQGTKTLTMGDAKNFK